MRPLAGPSSPPVPYNWGGPTRLPRRASSPPSGRGRERGGAGTSFSRAAPRAGTVTRRTDHGRSRAGTGGFAAPDRGNGGWGGVGGPLPGGPLAPGPVRLRAPALGFRCGAPRRRGSFGEEHEALRAREVEGGREVVGRGRQREVRGKHGRGYSNGTGPGLGRVGVKEGAPACGGAGIGRPELLGVRIG